MERLKKIISSKLFQNHTGTILLSLYLVVILGICSISFAASSRSNLVSNEENSAEVAEKKLEAKTEGKKSGKKALAEENELKKSDSNTNEKENSDVSSSESSSNSETDQNSASDSATSQSPVSNPATGQSASSTPTTGQSAPSNPAAGQSAPATPNRVWVEPVYETIEHPAVTKQRKYLAGVTCACGAYFSNANNSATGDWQAHRPVPCDGNHVYYTSHYEIETIVVQEAWTERVLVQEGYWKEGN